MPNWCYNRIVLTSDKENIDKLDAFLKEKNGEDWFDFFLPTPSELNDVTSPNRDGNSAEQLRLKYGASDWYDWNVSNWGCKWNCSAQNVERYDENTISFTFDSPWAPPGTLYRRIADGEFGEYDVTADYLEEGMGFVGRFSDGFDDYYEYTDLESLDEIPDEIVDQWNLREQLEDQAEWDFNEEEIEGEVTDDDILKGLDEILADYEKLSDEQKAQFKKEIGNE
jgi:hypothetical protein